MTRHEDSPMRLALVSALLAAACAKAPATSDAMAAAGTCRDSGSTSTVPCMGFANPTTVSLKRGDSGSTSTVPYSSLQADCTSSGSDSGSTSTVPCTIVVKKK